jgi:hypothetical protein
MTSLRCYLHCQMKKMMWCLILAICCTSECLAQQKWVLPKLQELTDAEAIKRGAAHLSAEERALIVRATKKVIADCVEDPGLGDPRTASALFGRLRVRRVSLTPSGDAGFIVQGSGVCMCGAVGNCAFWIIDEKPNPQILLARHGIQTFAFQHTKSSDHFDLILGSHDSAMVTDLQRFRFSGTKYLLNGCASLEWDDEIGNRLEPPRITSGRCKSTSNLPAPKPRTTSTH